MSESTFPDKGLAYDYYWDRDKHLPRFYISERKGGEYEPNVEHTGRRKSSICEEDLEQFMTPVAEEILTVDSVPLTGKGLLFGNVVQLKEDDDKLTITFDVDHCRADEISVRTVGRSLIVEGCEETPKAQKHNRFLRKFYLPKMFDAKSVSASVSLDGKLTIEMPISSASTTIDDECPIRLDRG